MSKRRALILRAAVAASLVLCVVVLESCGRGFQTSNVDTELAAALSPTYAAIQSTVFDRRCAGCHRSLWAMAKLKLNEGTSYDALVGVVSTEQPDLKLIDPGKPDDSYLVMKLEGAPGITGDRMPPPERDPVDPDAIDAIREWIADGAPR
jgi:hypothetical protein